MKTECLAGGQLGFDVLNARYESLRYERRTLATVLYLLGRMGYVAPPDIKTLVSLNVRRCRKLEELPAGIGRMKELRELLLDHTAIRDIPISRDCLLKLKTLCASSCEELAKLPESTGYLLSLIQLDLSYSQIEILLNKKARWQCQRAFFARSLPLLKRSQQRS